MVDILEKIQLMSKGTTQIVYQDNDGQIIRSPQGGYDIIHGGSNDKEKKERYARLLEKLKKLDPGIKVASYSNSKR